MKLHALNWRVPLMGDHCYLDTTDECYFAGEYETLDSHAMKSQILALKQGAPIAIANMAEQLGRALPVAWKKKFTFVPMFPCSRRNSFLREMVKRLPAADIRDLLLQVQDTPASHSGWRPTPEQRAMLLVLNELEAHPPPKTVVVIDDVLATGSHFRSAKIVIRRRWPQMRVIGVFLARARLKVKCVANPILGDSELRAGELVCLP